MKWFKPLIRVSVLISATLLVAGFVWYRATRPQVMHVFPDGSRIEVGRDGRTYQVMPDGGKFFFSSSKTGKVFGPETVEKSPATQTEQEPAADASPGPSKGD